METYPAYQNIMSRTSVRTFLDRPVPDEIKEALLCAAMAAPSGVNHHQPWEFIVIGAPVKLQALADALPYTKSAANAFGLGGVWTCIYPHKDRIEAAARILNLRNKLIPFNLIPIGYPKTPRPPMDKWTPARIHTNTL